MNEFRDENWKTHGMDYRSCPLKKLRLGRKKLSEMSCLEVYIETELDRRNLPEREYLENT